MTHEKSQSIFHLNGISNNQELNKVKYLYKFHYKSRVSLYIMLFYFDGAARLAARALK